MQKILYLMIPNLAWYHLFPSMAIFLPLTTRLIMQVLTFGESSKIYRTATHMKEGNELHGVDQGLNIFNCIGYH